MTTENKARRDAAANAALIALGPWVPFGCDGSLTHPNALQGRAALAYEQADAMMLASEQEDEA